MHIWEVFPNRSFWASEPVLLDIRRAVFTPFVLFVELSLVVETRSSRSWSTEPPWTGGLWGCWCTRWWPGSLRSKRIMKTTCLSRFSTTMFSTLCGSARRPCPYSEQYVSQNLFDFLILLFQKIFIFGRVQHFCAFFLTHLGN